MTRAELVEKIAREIREAPIRATIKGGNIIDGSLPMTPADLLRATAALAAIEAAGCVVVPKEATADMLDQAQRVLILGTVTDRGFIAEEYRAMLAASPLAPEPSA